MSRKTPGEFRARTCGTKSPSRSEAMRFIDSSKSPSTKIDGSLVNFRRRLSNRHGRPRRMLIWTFEVASDRLGDLVPQVRARTSPGVFRDMALLGLCLELSFNVLYCRTQANLPTLMHFAEPAIWPSSIRTEDPTCANHVDVLTVWSVFPSNVHINILRGLPCRLESLRLKFTNEPSIFVDGDLDESIKRIASDRLGNLVPQVRAREFSRGFSRHGAPRPLSWTFFQCTLLSYPDQPSYSHAFRWASDLAKFYQDWGPDLCESRWRAHSLIGVSFECPYQHPPWSPVSIGKPAPKIHQWTIYFCRWGFGWVDKAHCFRSARRFGAAGSSPDFSRGFSRHGAPRPLSWTFFQRAPLLWNGLSPDVRDASSIKKFKKNLLLFLQNENNCTILNRLCFENPGSQ